MFVDGRPSSKPCFRALAYEYTNRVRVRVRFIAALLHLVDERNAYLRGNHVVFRADCVLVTLVMFRFLPVKVREDIVKSW
jgi:hypothetical protein